MTTTTAPSLPRRVELLRDTLSERQAELEALDAELEALGPREEEARYAALTKAPTKRVYGVVGTEPEKLRKKHKTLSRKRAGLEAEIVTLARLVAEEEALEAAKKLKKDIAHGQELTAQEFEIWRRAGERFAALHDEVWLEYVEVLEARNSFLEKAEANPNAAGVDPELAEQWAEAGRFPIEPVPTSFFGFLQRLNDAMLDPSGNGYRDEGGARSDHLRRIPELVPDLREQARKPELSGKVDRGA